MHGRSLALLVLLVGLVVSGCGSKEPAAPAVLTGAISNIAAGESGDVTGFDLAAAGKSYNILIDPGRDYGFDLNHLYEHETTGDPVRVRLRAEDETLYALQIEDA